LGGDNGGIIYSSANKICSALDPNNTTICTKDSNNKILYNSTSYGGIVGIPFSDQIISKINKDIPECNNFSTSPDANSLCIYKNGVGMKIIIGSIVKEVDAPFTKSIVNNKLFFYHKATSSSKINFSTDFPLQNMFINSKKTMMQEWVQNNNLLEFSTASNLFSYLNVNNIPMSYVFAGSYVMQIDIGNGNANNDQYNNLKVEYLIQDDTSLPPTNTSVGQNKIDSNTSVTADKSGYLWLRVVNDNDELQGRINVEYLNYIGSTWFSRIVYLGVVKPINDQLQSFTKQFYIKFSRNASIINLVQGCLTLYIAIYGLMFLMGATRFTAEDFFYRILKIFIVTMIISENSWEFFNDYLFSIFTKGTDELFRSVTGTSSTTQNIFGFIDPILDKYTNPKLWGLLFIQLFQIHNGLTLVAIMSIYSLIIYFRAILEVIISYVISFVIISVMIGLAPLFIIFILFEKTRSLFDNWLSTLFNYMVQPSILLVFFLFIDQIISDQLLKIVVKSCWDTLITIAINMNLDHIGFSGVNFSFSIPFFPGIPFFIPQVGDIQDIQNIGTGNFLVIFTSTLLLYCYCLMAKGLVDYVSTIASQLMNVSPTTSDAKNAPSNPVENIMHDMKKASAPVVSAGTKPFRLFKDKIIDQNYSARQSHSNKPELYGNKIMESRDDFKGSSVDSNSKDGK
jgi:type IV secretion system protein VirB6